MPDPLGAVVDVSVGDVWITGCTIVPTGLPRTRRKLDCIWVIADRVTKFAHFLAFKITDSVGDYAKLYINEIVSLHGVPLSIISDRGPQLPEYQDLSEKISRNER